VGQLCGPCIEGPFLIGGVIGNKATTNQAANIDLTNRGCESLGNRSERLIWELNNVREQKSFRGGKMNAFPEMVSCLNTICH
jgi:hypothetical protein